MYRIWVLKDQLQRIKWIQGEGFKIKIENRSVLASEAELKAHPIPNDPSMISNQPNPVSPAVVVAGMLGVDMQSQTSVQQLNQQVTINKKINSHPQQNPQQQEPTQQQVPPSVVVAQESAAPLNNIMNRPQSSRKDELMQQNMQEQQKQLLVESRMPAIGGGDTSIVKGATERISQWIVYK